MTSSHFKTNARGAVLAFAILFGAIPAAAQSVTAPEIRQSEISRAYHKLTQAEIFNLGGIGWAQQVTAEETAFRKLLGSVDAPRLFQRLINEANAEGQLYALLGLRLRAPEAFQSAAEKLQARGGPPERLEQFRPTPKGKVRMGEGCLLYQTDWRNAIDGIANGKWDAAIQAKSSDRKF